MSSDMRAKVFGIPIEGDAIDRLLERVNTMSVGQPTWIVTTNPEILLEARSHSNYTNVLQQASVRTVDGFGLWFMLRLFGHKTTRVTGIDLAEMLVRQAVEGGWRVGLIGGGEGVAETAAQQIKIRYPALQVIAEHGGMIDRAGQDDHHGEEARHRLTLFDPQALFVAFGHPKQENWIAQHKNEFPHLKVVMGVGGTFEVWAGNIKRAPTAFRQLGLEWLWRLIQEPRRIVRMWNAVAVFPIYFLFEKIKKRHGRDQ